MTAVAACDQEVTFVHDDAAVGLDGLEVVFDDERPFSDAGIVLIATLAGRLGIEDLARGLVQLRADRAGAANVGRTVMALVFAMLLGADSIDDCDVLRAGRTRRLLGGWDNVSVFSVTGGALTAVAGSRSPPGAEPMTLSSVQTAGWSRRPTRRATTSRCSPPLAPGAHPSDRIRLASSVSVSPALTSGIPSAVASSTRPRWSTPTNVRA